ncbi:cytochrome P450 4V2-like [Gigantopelta aegis]|uniref:cytochrome P450 4V2-like n=1 Tax=Gigantopelta aegis TaxID=1735272 RepID=UPI001B88A140|nr:cytochrome P450 4V2-like [Gigantopelta aegis]
MAAVLLIVAVTSFILLLIWFFKTYETRQRVNQIPGRPALPLIGNAHQLQTSGFGFYKQLFDYSMENRDYGMFRIWLGVQPLVGIFKPEFVEKLLNSTTILDKAPVYNFLHPWLGTGLLTSTGTKWHTHRKLLTPTFHFKILNDFITVFNEKSQILTRRLSGKADGKPFNIFQHITLCALDIICETAMGKNVKAQEKSDSEYVTAVYKMGNLIMTRIKTPWFWNKLLFGMLGPAREHDRCLDILHQFTQQVIENRRDQLKTRTSGDQSADGAVGEKKRLAFLDLLLNTMHADGSQQLTDEEICEEVDTFMFEGHDTTAAAMNWTIYLIGSHQDIQERIHRELDEIFGNTDRMVTSDDLKEMKYLERCIKEALRLFPSVPSFGRTLTQDLELGKVKLPVGTAVAVFLPALHRNADFFPDPDVFDPDRFSPENSVGRHPYAYVPFSAGMRNCIGQKFALMEEKIVLSSILRKFHVESVQTQDELRPQFELILRPENGIIVKLTERKLQTSN